MFGFFKKQDKGNRFDRKVLRRNDISILILDERWNSLFNSAPKTPEILKYEEQLRELLKEQARLIEENRDILQRKKDCMDRIIKLTTEAFENNKGEAKKEMQQRQKDILGINERLSGIESELDSLPARIREVNLELLEYMVNMVYYKISSDRKRVKELEGLIEETREKLKHYIDEKEVLAQSNTDIYTYLHDLLGGEELERLDKLYME